MNVKKMESIVYTGIVKSRVCSVVKMKDKVIMKVISDIRIYRSMIENIDGNSLPSGFDNKLLHITLHRIAMKLRENGFSLGDFDHLYINMTTCPVDDKISMAKRTIDRYHPFYRFYDAEVSQEFLDSLTDPQCVETVGKIIETVLVKYFCTTVMEEELVHSCISDALKNGENMTVKYKEKTGAKNKAVIYLRYLDNTMYAPQLKVYDLAGNIMLEKDLLETATLDSFGEIQLSTKKVTVKPRKNCFAKNLEPITITL